MQKTPNLFKRKMYLCGNKMIAFPFFSSFIPITTTATIASGTIVIQQYDLLKNKNLSNLEFFILLIERMALIGFSILLFMIVVKGFLFVFGHVLRFFGERDKIEFLKGKDSKVLELIITNNESEEFSGQFKIMKINDEELGQPLLMGILHNGKIEDKITIPKNEPISVALGLFDDKTDRAYFPDFHNENKPLNPQTRVYTKLSGNLKGGAEIIKEDMWFINYKDCAGEKKLGFANLLEIKNLRG